MDKLYIHVTVHRNKFLFNNQPDASIIQIYSVTKLHRINLNNWCIWLVIKKKFTYGHCVNTPQQWRSCLHWGGSL